MENISQVFYTILLYSPVLLVALAGIVFSVSRRQRFPREAFYTLIASIIILLIYLGSAVIFQMLPSLLHKWGWASSKISLINTSIGFIINVLMAIAIGLYLAATYDNRKY
jgi:hypothetical protein